MLPMQVLNLKENTLSKTFQSVLMSLFFFSFMLKIEEATSYTF